MKEFTIRLKLLDKILKSEFRKNVITLVTGTIISQSIPILISPILTRIYSPDDFGQYGLFLSIISILSVISSGRYDRAIFLPKKNEDGINLMVVGILITFFFSILITITILIFKQSILIFFNLREAKILYLVPISLFILGVYNCIIAWNNRMKYYKDISINQVIQSSTSSGTQTILGKLMYNKSGLVIGIVFSQLVSLIVIIKKTKNKDVKYLKSINKQKIKQLSKRYVSFVKFGIPALLTSSIAKESLILLVSNYLSVIIIGYINIIQRIINIPSSIIGRNLGNVFFQKISQTKRSETYPIILNFIKKLVLTSIISYFIVFIILNNYFGIIFGEEWGKGIFLLKYLIITSCFSFVFAPLSVLFDYFEIQKLNLLWQLCWLISNIILFLFYKKYNLTIDQLFTIYTIKQSLLYTIGIVGFIFISKLKANEK